MLLLISWRNVWRNKKRSLIIIAAIAVGLWAGLFTMAVSYGVVQQMIESSITTRLSHIQIHRPGFKQHLDIELTIPGGDELLAELHQLPEIKHSTERAVIGGMASSPATASGVEITGISPKTEREMTDIPSKILEGTYFETSKRNPALIGEKLANRLNVKVGGKIVLTAQANNGDLSAGAFRIVGIYKTANSQFDETIVFVNRNDIDRIFTLNGEFHEIAILLNENVDPIKVRDEIKSLTPGLDVQTWQELSPDLALMTEATDQQLYILLIIILLALVFGITNTMLMGVIERTRELGVIMALGMKPFQIFIMIFYETMLLSLIGATAGILLGAGTIAFFGKVGLNMANFAEGLASFGMGSVWYPTLRWSDYPNVVILVMLTAIISALYPGIRAVKLKPVEAIRTY